jgi:predicted nucleotidyltransferase
MNLTRKEQQILQGLVARVRRLAGAKEVILYGSAARSDLDEGSDIDLLVVLPRVTWDIEKQISDLCFAAELQCGRVVSAVCFSESELRETPLRVSPLVVNARREGIPL